MRKLLQIMLLGVLGMPFSARAHHLPKAGVGVVDLLIPPIEGLRQQVVNLSQNSIIDKVESDRNSLVRVTSSLCQGNSAVVKLKTQEIEVGHWYESLTIDCANSDFTINLERRGKQVVPLSRWQWMTLQLPNPEDYDLFLLKIPSKNMVYKYQGGMGQEVHFELSRHISKTNFVVIKGVETRSNSMTKRVFTLEHPGPAETIQVDTITYTETKHTAGL